MQLGQPQRLAGERADFQAVVDHRQCLVDGAHRDQDVRLHHRGAQDQSIRADGRLRGRATAHPRQAADEIAGACHRPAGTEVGLRRGQRQADLFGDAVVPAARSIANTSSRSSSASQMSIIATTTRAVAFRVCVMPCAASACTATDCSRSPATRSIIASHI